MFVWDFVLTDLMDQFVQWIYGQTVGFLGNFFANMGEMGVELFDMPWVESIVLFFSYLAWALYVVGLVVSCFEVGIEYQNGGSDVKAALLNGVKGFMAVSLFSTVPVELFALSVNLQSKITAGITGSNTTFAEVATEVVNDLGETSDIGIEAFVSSGIATITSPIMMLFIVIMMAYAVIKVFFANLKRGGILLIQIAVGSLYMFSVPRGFTDGFISWCKQIIALCLTTFLQATMLTAGLMVLNENALLGLGLMLAAGDVPQIAGAFGLDTAVKPNVRTAIYSAQSAVSLGKNVMKVIPK